LVVASACIIRSPNDDDEDGADLDGSETNADDGSDFEGGKTSDGDPTFESSGTGSDLSETGADRGTIEGGAGSETAGEDTGEGGETTIACADDNGSIVLPEGFCATIFADNLGRARHMAVTPSGDLLVAVGNPLEPDGPTGQVVTLRDGNSDGVSDIRALFGDVGGNGIAWWDGFLYLAQDNQVLRYPLADGELLPTGDPEAIVVGLPDTGDHTAKTIVITDEGELFVNIGSASNSCQVENRALASPGIDPCEELDVRAGVWRFDASTPGQDQASGVRFATGVRNANALALHPETGDLWAAQNGRDQLFENWPDLFTADDDLRLPAEELLPLIEGADYGWPYCYFDAELGDKVLAPEYGGNGIAIGRCEDAIEPAAVLPAHWAPLGIHFYRGDQFPERYRGGAFIANHGSRFEPEAVDPPGYDVVFVPFDDGTPTDAYEVFAEDFAGEGRPLPEAAEYRPVGLAESPDGSLYISDDVTGRIWRVTYGVM